MLIEEENFCGICLNKINLKKKIQICNFCNKAVHMNCWNQWIEKKGTCIYCNYQIIKNHDNRIFNSDEDQEFMLERILEYDSSSYSEEEEDEEWIPEEFHSYNLRTRSVPNLRSRRR